jgi:hypothetical protein
MSTPTHARRGCARPWQRRVIELNSTTIAKQREHPGVRRIGSVVPGGLVRCRRRNVRWVAAGHHARWPRKLGRGRRSRRPRLRQ